ncbi:MAG: hypothetical protein R3D33_04385 [Hyphomicrobiaceae bacterium]
MTLAASAAIAFLMSAPAGAAPCLDGDQPIKGEIREVRTRDSGGRNISAYHLVLPHSACVSVRRIGEVVNDVRSIELLPPTADRKAELASLVGRKVEFSGRPALAVPGRHSGDMVLKDAVPAGAAAGYRRKAEAEDEDGDGDGEQTARAGDPVPDFSVDGDPVTRSAPLPDDEDVGAVRRPDDEITDDGGAGAGDDRRLAEEEGARDREAGRVDPDAPDIDERIARFIRDYYLGSAALSPEQIRTLYATRLDYFGRHGVPVERVVSDKLGYYRRWPKRSYVLIEDTLDIRRLRGTRAVFDVAFEYEFKVGNGSQRRGGRGLSILTFDLGDGSGRIVREEGEVVERYF